MSDFDPFADERPPASDKTSEDARRGDAARPQLGSPAPAHATPLDFDPWADEPEAHDVVPESPSKPSTAGLSALWQGDDDAPRRPRHHRSSTGGADDVNPAETPTPGSILVVCTGNVCRSPYIERRLAAGLSDAGITVTSAGTGALVGEGIDPGSVALLDAAGIPSDGFVARQLTEQMVRDADLVVTATRHHRREVVQLVPAGLGTTFALVDLADLLEGLTEDDVSRAGGASRLERVVRAAVIRRAQVQARLDDSADIVDPFRQGPQVFEQMQREADPAIDVVIRALLAAA